MVITVWVLLIVLPIFTPSMRNPALWIPREPILRTWTTWPSVKVKVPNIIGVSIVFLRTSRSGRALYLCVRGSVNALCKAFLVGVAKWRQVHNGSLLWRLVTFSPPIPAILFLLFLPWLRFTVTFFGSVSSIIVRGSTNMIFTPRAKALHRFIAEAFDFSNNPYRSSSWLICNKF